MIFIRTIFSFFPFCSKNGKIEKWHRHRPIFHYSIFTWKIEKCHKYFDQNFHFFILIDRKFGNWIMICNFWPFLLISVWIKKWNRSVHIVQFFWLFQWKKVNKFDHFLTPCTYFTSSQKLITKEIGQNYKRAIN